MGWKQPETSIEQSVCDYVLKHYGVIGIKMEVGSGWPDRQFILLAGRVLWIEFKKPGEPPKRRQIARHDFLREVGHKVEVHDNRELAIKSIVSALEASRKEVS